MDAAAKKARAEIEKAHVNHERSIQWQNRARQLEAELASARQGTSVPPSQAGQSPQAPQRQPFQPPPRLVDQDPLEGIDFEAARAIEAEHGTMAATTWIVQEALKRQREQFQASQDEFARPFQEQQKIQARIERGRDLFNGLRNMADDDGTKHFPELENDDVSYRIANLWLQQYGNLPEEWVYQNPFSLYSAIAVWRDAQAHEDAYLKRRATPAEVAPVAEQMIGQTPAVPGNGEGNGGAPAVADLGSGLTPPLGRRRPRSGFDTEQFKKLGVLP
jgi:hypothetical protein